MDHKKQTGTIRSLVAITNNEKNTYMGYGFIARLNNKKKEEIKKGEKFYYGGTEFELVNKHPRISKMSLEQQEIAKIVRKNRLSLWEAIEIKTKKTFYLVDAEVIAIKF